MPDVRMPDGTIIKDVPEGTTQAELQSRLDAMGREPLPVAQTPVPEPGFLSRFNSTFAAMNPGLMGVADAGTTIGTGSAAVPISGFAGLGALPRGADAAAEAVANTQEALTFQPRTEVGQGIVGGLGALVEPLSQAADRGVERFGPQLPSLFTRAFNPSMAPAVDALTDAGAFESPLIQAGQRAGVEVLPGAIPAFRGARAAGQTRKAVQSAAPTRRSQPRSITVSGPGEAIPSVGELFDAAGVAFTEARRLGGQIEATSLARATNATRNIKTRGGLRLDFDPDLHPQSFRVRQRILDDLDTGDIDFDELLTLRELAGEVAGSQVPAEALRGVKLKNIIDDFVNNLQPGDVVSGNPQQAAQAIDTARRLWRDASASREIERQIALAEVDAGQFTGSGFENALRTRFRQLSRRIINDQEKGFTQAEADAIRLVAEGNSLDNVLRFVGKAAPTGVVSAGVGSGVGGFLFGPVGAVGVPTAGFLARRAATNRTINNARTALETALQNSLIQP